VTGLAARPEELADVALGTGSPPTRLGQVATVRLAAHDETHDTRVNGQQGVLLRLTQQAAPIRRT
jgi:multidrug efflux pump subunit AcrB